MPPGPLQRRFIRLARLGAFAVFVATVAAVIISCSPSEPFGKYALAHATTKPDPAVETAKGMGLSYAVAPGQNRDEAEMKTMNAGCITCHGEYGGSDSHSMHAGNVVVSCVDCHGGSVTNGVAKGLTKEANPVQYELAKAQAHVQPRQATRSIWTAGHDAVSSANPSAPGATTLNESPDYIRFVNPGDLHVARAACGACHNNEKYGYIHDKVDRNMMAHGAMLWQAALYNNGAINRKNALYGEAYRVGSGKDNLPVLLPVKLLASADPKEIPSAKETLERGWLPVLMPLMRYEVSQPGNVLRVFERGGAIRPQVGVPERAELSGKPDVKLSVRGFGTDVRTDPVFLGLQKTRLLDPTLNLFGSNDHAGDYRGSGCTACHVVYANDSSSVHSGPYARHGNKGYRGVDSTDKAVPFNESGHPIHHVFAPRSAIPSSQCIVCHIHPGTNVVNAYLGYTWWDNEIDGDKMYPAKQKYPTPEQEAAVSDHNPEGSAPRGLWSDLYPGEKSVSGDVAPKNFLDHTGSAEFNAKLEHTQFADFHGHGWVYRAVFKRDRHGNMLDSDGNVISQVTAAGMKAGIDHADPDGKPTPPGTPVHLKDIHLQMGMHCVDCHFQQDVHGDGKLYGETRNAIAESCIDCHGTAEQPAAIVQYLKEANKSEDDRDEKKITALKKRLFTGNAASNASPDLVTKMVRNFELDGDKLVQKSMVNVDSEGKPTKWTVKQTSDQTVDADKWNDPASAHQAKALWAHTVRKDGKTWGSVPAAEEQNEQMKLAHGSNSMSCYACHTSWNTSCFGCHLPMKANAMKPMLHNEGSVTRNYTNYNFQTIRDDVYMLGKDSTVKGGAVVPVRSACAVLVSSQDANRQWLYTQQQTISAEGLAGTAFSPYFPHTVRTTETKQCTDCHLSEKNDNNAVMAQLLMQGTKSVNFVGRFAWVATKDKGLEAVAVTERDEPQAVIGSRLHEWAFPDYYKKHVESGGELKESYEHGHYTVNDVQLRGEYLYAACGPDGFVAFDVANIDNKGFSERILTAPVSPLGQRLYVKTTNATSVCSPSTLALDPTRPHLPENQEQHVAPLYAYIYVTDSAEGLVVIGNAANDPNGPGVSTLLDGDPNNNFLSRALAFNPNGALNGAKHMRLLGHYAYVACDAGIRVVDLADPLHPRLLDTPGLASITRARKIFFQFRYGLVLDGTGLKTIDVTDPEKPTLVAAAAVPVADARDIYVTRTYGYLAAGREGLWILDLENPEQPKVVQKVTDHLHDTTAVRVGMTNSSLYAYVADGTNGLHVYQLTSSDTQDNTPTFLGFSPKPMPRHIAHYETEGPAVSLSEGLDRDRAVDESGDQLAVFGRRGARPFTLAEMQRLYLKIDASGAKVPYRVTDTPPAAPTADAAPGAKPKDE